MEEFGNVICMLSHFKGSWSNNLSVSKAEPLKISSVTSSHLPFTAPSMCSCVRRQSFASSMDMYKLKDYVCVILGTLITSGTFQVSAMIKSTCRHLHFKPFKFLYCGSLHHHDKTLTRSQPFHRKSQRNLIPYTIPIP